MAQVNMQQVKELRDRTQAGLNDCRAALVEAEGDLDKAVEIILKKGLAKSAKRAGAIAAEGEVLAQIWRDGRAASIVEVNIQTDFAARNDQFKAFARQVAALTADAELGADLSAALLDGKAVVDVASELTAKLGEKIAVRRWDRLEVSNGKHGFCYAYVHFGGRIGVVLTIEAETEAAAGHAAVKEFAEETALQIAAMAPVALKRDEVSEVSIAKQREIFEAQLRDEPKPKPENIWPKIIDGKVDKWFAEVVLLEQESAQHKKKIDDLRKEVGKAAGAGIAITAFRRYELGEGIAKTGDDLTKGVAELLET